MWAFSVFITFHTQCCAKSLQLCPTLCDAMDRSPPGSSVSGILQARILEWVHALLQGPSQPRDGTQLFCPCTGRQVLHHWCSLGSHTQWCWIFILPVARPQSVLAWKWSAGSTSFYSLMDRCPSWYLVMGSPEHRETLASESLLGYVTVTWCFCGSPFLQILVLLICCHRLAEKFGIPSALTDNWTEVILSLWNVNLKFTSQIISFLRSFRIYAEAVWQAHVLQHIYLPALSLEFYVW